MRTGRNRRPVMVAVRELNRAAMPLLRKAAALARLHAAPLRLVHVAEFPQSIALNSMGLVQRALVDEVRVRRARLRKLAASPLLRGIATRTVVREDSPVVDGLVREVMAHRPRLLLAQAHRHGLLARLWLSNTDWELIRHCPCPLWLSKTPSLRRIRRILAAVDPLHAHDKPARLDADIVRQAVQAAEGRLDRVSLCHVYSLPAPVVVGAVEAYWVPVPEEERLAHEARLNRALRRLHASSGIPVENSMLRAGDPAVELSRAAKRLHADLVVMGAVSRRGLKRVFIGNTAERVLDSLPCDVLVVKPRGFRTAVPMRVRPFRST